MDCPGPIARQLTTAALKKILMAPRTAGLWPRTVCAALPQSFGFYKKKGSVLHVNGASFQLMRRR
jgi:hypothetical protein